ncbi:MAG: glycosyltransferase [Candidatus Omnitrophica bacterium]|jgi:glycosyltransferase involved in cell wall biosynthesis|nr:glycosyltransferase [Candidatus Omnitrophota bacterium]
MKVAIIHDWLNGMRGGEKCLEVFCELFPRADIFTLLYDSASVSPVISNMPVKTSFIQHLPFALKKYRNYLPLFPAAVESFNLTGYDFILSSSHSVAKGARKPKNAFHLCYCYTPMRYVWSFFEQYFGSYPFLKKKIVSYVTENLKKWDLKTLDRVDEFVAISKTIQKRINDIYKRDSNVIYPPVDCEKFILNSRVKREDFYLCISALVPYKRIDIIIDAFSRCPDKKIFIIGDGHLRKELERKVSSQNIKLLGWVADRDLILLCQRAKAFVYAAEEDFGISPLEAQATGSAVIAYGKGGVSETIISLADSRDNAATGVFFYKQESEALIEAIGEFEKHLNEFDPVRIRNNAIKFSRDNFKNNFRNFIKEKLNLN